MKTFEFKKLEIQHKESWVKRKLLNPHVKRTLVLAAIGAIAAYAIFYFSQGAGTKAFWNEDAFNHVLMGLGLGVFITNSPCARGRC